MQNPLWVRILIEITRPILLGLWRLMGWRGEGALPDSPSMVLVGVPHTSNWDYFHMFGAAVYFRRKPYVTIKDSAFKNPILGSIIQALGGISIDRSRSTNAVDQMAESLENANRRVLCFTPEGTRKKTDNWRTGFYYTALKAEVPIGFIHFDYRRKRVGSFGHIYPTGDIDADFEKIREYYDDHGYGKYPDQKSDIIPRQR
jgi:1-acyl-sn-glycerol-3-phosphate acyltransferase